jgi:hypothetical protein
MADKPAVEAPPAQEAVDLSKVKTMLNLPETAKDIEVISSLIELIAGLQQKYDALLGDAVEMEDKLANRDLQDFQDLMTPETQEFWKEQLLRNRESALNVLSVLRNAHDSRQPPVQPVQSEMEKRPLFRNRLLNPVRTMTELVEETPAVTTTRAVKIRNRAQEIRSQEKIPYALAFARAEKEIE